MFRTGALICGVLLACSADASAQSLRGSPRGMQQQNRVAQKHDYTFLQTTRDVQRFAELGLLVRLRDNADYTLNRVSHPYARPAVKLFIERLASQYRSACGEKLVITSLTRPVREQPRNASELSVHPAGMAVDLRISRKGACRTWLERTVLGLEKQGVLDAIRERTPPHYHIALYPEPYTRYVARLTGSNPARLVTVQPPPKPAATAVALRSETMPAASGPSDAADEPSVAPYRVHRGDTLWSIARRHGTTVDALKELNGLTSSRLNQGQTLSVPVAAGAAGS